MTIAYPIAHVAAAHSRDPTHRAAAALAGWIASAKQWNRLNAILATITTPTNEAPPMSYSGPAMGIPQNWNARQAAELDRRAAAEPRDDRYVTKTATAAIDPELRAAIAQREAKVLADVQARNLAAVVAQHKAQHEAGSSARCRAIQARLFAQVAIGGIRNGRS